MIQEIIIFSMGFLFASLIKQMKIISITREKSKELTSAMLEAEKMQEEFRKTGGSEELCERQIESYRLLEKHIGYKEMLKYFNYIIW